MKERLNDSVKLWHFIVFVVVQTATGIWMLSAKVHDIDTLKETDVRVASEFDAIKSQVARIDYDGSHVWNYDKPVADKNMNELKNQIAGLQNEMRQTREQLVSLIAISRTNQKLLKGE